MTDPIFDPNNGQVPTSTPVQNQNEPQGIFGGSEDIFNNPDMFEIPTPKVQKHEDFDVNLDNIEPEIIEPQSAYEYPVQTTEDIPEPEIIEQIVEPQMKPEVKVNPRKQNSDKSQGQSTKDSSNEQKPEPRPVQPQVSRPQERPQVQPQPKPEPVQVVRPPEIKPQVQAPRPTPQPQIQPQAKSEPVQIVRPPEPKPQPQIPRPPQPTIQEVKAPEIQISKSAGSDIGKKVEELKAITKSLYALEKKDPEQAFEVLGADNDTITILYQFNLLDNAILIKKRETEKATGEELVNDLGFVHDEDRSSRQVILDDVLLFDELEHLQDEPKKKMQVMEKLNKFIFLLGEQYKKLEKETKEREEAESERKRLQDIFRNF